MANCAQGVAAFFGTLLAQDCNGSATGNPRPDAAFRAQVLATSPALQPILDAFPVGQISNGDGVSAELRVQKSNKTREDSGMMRLDYPEPLTKVVHPTRNASTGLMDAARLAGMIPAMAADTASVAAAATITVIFTLLIS